LFNAGNAQNSVEMGEILRNEEEIRNYIIGVAFGGLEDTTRKEGPALEVGPPTGGVGPPIGVP